MYTIDDQIDAQKEEIKNEVKEELKNEIKDEFYDDEEDEEYGTWYSRRGLVFKIIIIILCVVALILLIKALKGNRALSTKKDEVHAANTEKLRLAAEEYFFVDNNKSSYSFVSLARLKENGYIDDIVDANNKVCDEHSTKANLTKDTDAYVMKIKFSCSTNDKAEVFYYHRNTLACLNCNGKTNMTGNTVVAKADEKKETKVEENKGVVENDNNDVQSNNNEYSNYSCVNWSDWTKDRIFDASLTERSKTLVQGVKYGTKSTYGEWSEYSTTPIVGSETIEVETKTLTESYWSDYKTAKDIDPSRSNIRVVSSKTIEEGDSCSNGFVENGVCYSNNTKRGNLTFKEYNSGKYRINKDYCDGVQTLMNSNGQYVLTYVNCEYNEVIGKINTPKKTSTLYTYQVLETRDVVYYRYRTLNTVIEPDIYTDTKYEEAYLPEGYVKVPGSEETYYSYKLTECVK